MRKILFSILSMMVGFASCSGVPDNAARRYIEENIKSGSVNFLTATELDSTSRISPETMKELRSRFAKTGNLKVVFPNECPKMLYYTMIRYTVTHDNGSVDTLLQTVYMDKEQTTVYGIKNN